MCEDSWGKATQQKSAQMLEWGAIRCYVYINYNRLMNSVTSPHATEILIR